MSTYRRLTPGESQRVIKAVNEFRAKLTKLAAGDPTLRFALNRKSYKQLIYDERGTPGARRKMKALKWEQQNGKCAECRGDMPMKYSELDRKRAPDGYTIANTELIHAHCHHKRQADNGYT